MNDSGLGLAVLLLANLGVAARQIGSSASLCNSRNKFPGQGSRVFTQSNEVVYNVSHPCPKLMDVPEAMLYRRDVRSAYHGRYLPII